MARHYTRYMKDESEVSYGRGDNRPDAGYFLRSTLDRYIRIAHAQRNVNQLKFLADCGDAYSKTSAIFAAVQRTASIEVVAGTLQNQTYAWVHAVPARNLLRS